MVFQARSGQLTDPPLAAQVQKTLAEIKVEPHVIAVTDPLSPQGAASLSPSKTIAYSTVSFDTDVNGIAHEIGSVRSVVDTALSHNSPTLRVEAGGTLVTQAQTQKGSSSEGIGFLAAFIILAITFGTVAAAAVPLVTAAVALACGLAIDGLVSHTITIAQFTPQLATLIGLGVGIDYALFLVSRFRTELHKGETVEEAVVTAVNTSGRAATFAGITVCIALLGMIVLGVNFLVGVGRPAASPSRVTMFASVTLLPAMLGVLGHKVRPAAAAPDARPRRGPDPRRERWAALIQRRPVIAATAGLIIVVLLALPAISLRLRKLLRRGHEQQEHHDPPGL